MAGRDWMGASSLFEEIERTEPDFRDVKNLLEQVQTEKERQEKFVDLVAEGKEYLEKKREWLKAIAIFQQALILDSGNSEVQTLLSEAERGQKVKDLFDAAQKHMFAEQWPEAIAKFQAVLELEPAHVEANRQLANAMIKLARQEETQTKRMAEPEEPVSRLMKPVSFPEAIKPSRPGSLPEKIQPSKPGSLPEEIKPGKKPRDLPK
jgi:tetratricopeptide (TPR) repeat protein